MPNDNSTMESRFDLRFQKYHIATNSEAKCLDEFELYEQLKFFIQDEISRAVGEEMAKITSHPAFKALGEYEQADEDGVMVLVSRQAIDEIKSLITKQS